jgi:cytochrome c-type biogenesis protein CcmE
MTRRQRRTAAIAGLLLGLGLAAALGFTAFRKNLMYFYTPSDLMAGQIATGQKLRLGGLVERGSVQHREGLRVEFVLGDCLKTVKVRHDGILPDLFREGQGIVATGSIATDGVFVADEVLAKHDENYMPPQLAKSLKTQNGDAGGHSCAPFKSVSRLSEKPRPSVATDVPLPQAGEGRADGGAIGGVRAVSP